ncbi:MAG TPA: cytochrome c [Caldimonas sp.]|nr:cytochrome c [Caldimonas sp.]
MSLSFPLRRAIVALALAVVVVAAAGCAALAWHRDLPAIAAAPLAFDAATVERGARLAAIGSCASCHTTREGRPYAGGVALATPFGTIHGTNITPDRETGIGAWSEAAFVRAMREGVARDGSLLYPAFPYDHFTHTADDDLHALYAYLMTRDPVRAANRANDLRFPFGLRPLVAGWNLLFLREGAFQGDPAHSPEWNRGAYLVESLGHCGACHTPRNALGAERRREAFSGGEAEGWYVPALNDRSPSPLPWTVEQLTAYLRTGIAADHAIAGGPMQEVIEGLARADAGDVRAIAVYIDTVLGATTPERQARAAAALRRAAQGPLAAVPIDAPASSAEAQTLRVGAAVYDGACASCHDAGRAVASHGALRLPLAIAVYDPDPRSLLRIVRDGIVPAPAEPGRWMPAFGTTLTDEQLVGLLSHLRTTAAGAPPWPDLAKAVRETRTTP